MAYIVNSFAAQGASAGSVTVSLPPHQTNDLLLVFLANDGGGGTIGAPAGWTLIGTQAASGASRSIFAYKIAASGAEADPAFTTSVADDWSYCVSVWRDVDTTTPIHGNNRSDWNNINNPTSPALTTTNNDCVLVYGIGSDTAAAARNVFFNPSDLISVGGVGNSAAIICTVGYRNLLTAGAAPTVTMLCDVNNEGGNYWVIAINNASGGAMGPQVSQSQTVLYWYSEYDKPTLAAPNSEASFTTLLGLGLSATALNGTNGQTDYLAGRLATLSSTESSAGIWVGGIHALGAAADLSDGIYSLTWGADTPMTSTSQYGTYGAVIVLMDGTDWAAYQLTSKAANQDAGTKTAFFDFATATPVDSSGSVDLTAITKIAYLYHRAGSSASARALRFGRLLRHAGITLVGGSAGRPLAPSDLGRKLTGHQFWDQVRVQGQGQTLTFASVQIGDGTTPTYYDAAAQSLEFPGAFSPASLNFLWNAAAGSAGLTIYAGASDTINLGASITASPLSYPITIHASSSTSATYNFTGASFVYGEPAWKTGVDCVGATFDQCTEIAAAAADIQGCTIKRTRSTDAAIAFDANGGTLDGTTIDVTDTDADYHLELGTAVTAMTLTDVSFVGTPGVDKVHVKRTTGTVTITIAGTTSLVAGDVTSDGATVSIVAPTFDLVVNSSESGTLIQVFTTTTQTILASTTGATLTYTHSDETVDIVVQKAGFLPQREVGVVLSGDVGRSYTLTQDPVYDAAHGLAYTTDASWSRAANQLTVPTWGPTVRAVYSLMIDSFISEAGLRNTAFNIQMNGPNSLFLIEGAEGASDTTPANMTGGGVRYVSASGVTTAEWCGVRSIGTATGFTGEYQQTAGSGTTDARATGAFNQTIKTYGDASHGNFDRRAHLVLKFQPNGYRPTRVDVLATYGVSAIEPVLYIVAMEPPVIAGLTLGDPGALSLALTDHGASPVTWDAGDGNKDYSITVTDSGATSGADILRWLNYNLSLDATFEGKDPFNWPELVIDNGAEYETVRGQTEGGTGASIKGVRVLRGSDPHPDFSRFQADDGTYGTPPVVASAAITSIVSGSRVQIYNVTTATEIYNDVPGASYSDSYVNGSDYTDGDQVRVRITYCVGTSAKLEFTQTVVAAETGWSVVASQEDDEVYNALAIDGSAVTGFAADYAADEVNVTVAANFYVSDLYAWWVYNLTTSQGISDFFGGLTALDQGNFRIEQGTVDIYLDNTTATNLRQLDNRRIFREDEAYPVKSSGGGGIDVVWRNTILIAETGVSGLTPEESTWLAKLDSIDIAAGRVAANVTAVNDIEVDGSGTEGDPWGPV